METILSGLAGGSPRVILSTFSMPWLTRPHTVYWPSRKVASSKQMKNWLSAESGDWRARHGHGAAGMRLLGELGAKLLAGAAAPRAGGIAGLRHEAVDDAVEHHAVIEALTRELLDALDVVRREVGAQLHGDRPARRLDDQGILGCCRHFGPPIAGPVSTLVAACFRCIVGVGGDLHLDDLVGIGRRLAGA